MNVPTWQILIPLLLVSGAIAYAGDLIGKNLGKKRLSFFGLRPKQTAQVCSVVSGVSILVFSLAIMLSVSENAREGLLHLNDIKQKRAEREREIRTLTADISKGIARNARLQEQTSESLQLKAEADRQRALAVRSLDSVRRELGKAEAGLKQAKRKLQIAAQELKVAERDRDGAGKQAIDLERRNVTLRAEVRDREATVARLEERANILQGALIDVLRTPILYQRGQIIASTVINVGSRSEAQVRRDVEALLLRASQEAAALGASQEESSRAVVLAPRPELDGKLITEEAQLERTARDLVRQTTTGNKSSSFIVDVVALYNAFKGYKVDAELGVYENVTVYRPGDEISTMSIAGDLPAPQIFGKLQELIEEGRAAALRKSLRPRRDTIYDPATRDRVFECLRRLEQNRSPVTVRLVAEVEIRAADYLRVRFDTGPRRSVSDTQTTQP